LPDRASICPAALLDCGPRESKMPTSSTSSPLPAGRIVSLLPSATEILCAVGCRDRIVGCTHECDFPPGISDLPHVTRSLLPRNLTSEEIDTAVCGAMVSDDHTIYALDDELLRKLAPDAIVTQKLCDVCAVPERDVQKLACTLPKCDVVSADPVNLRELFESILTVGRAVRAPGTAQLVSSLRARLDRVERITRGLAQQRVAVLEWPSPPYAPGHWVPDMVTAAGGVCALGASGEKSVRITWGTLAACEADIIVCAFCGFNLVENQERLKEVAHVPEWIAIASQSRVFASDASAFYSRPGPRLIDGVELLAYVLHEEPGTVRNIVTPAAGQMSELVDGRWIDVASRKALVRQAPSC
jgi:iron complex transport system substrate-binding protein